MLCVRDPSADLVPKDIFLKITRFLIDCSAWLFVGSTSGYFRKVNNRLYSFLGLSSLFLKCSAVLSLSGVMQIVVRSEYNRFS